MGFSSPQHLSYQEVMAYAVAMGRPLSPSRIRWIMMMDDLFMDAWAQAHMPEQPKAKALAPTQQVPMRKVPTP